MYDFISTKLCTYVVGNSTYTYFFPEIDILWSHKFRKILNLHSRLSSGMYCSLRRVLFGGYEGGFHIDVIF